MKTIQIFISSPSDVLEERQIAGRVIERLQGKYWSFVRLDDVFWETRAIRATGHYQDELIDPGDCDIVIGILWSRLGSPLPQRFRSEAGKHWTSGTEWELERAFDAFEKDLVKTGDSRTAKPDIIVYRRRGARIPGDDVESEGKAKEQWERLEEYLAREYTYRDDTPGGRATIKRPVIKYDLKEFERKLFSDLDELIVRQIPTLGKGYEPPPISGCPFMDLRAFDLEDSDRFFGRNREIREVQRRLQKRVDLGKAFVLIYGGSGFGKSSLMRAGVAPVVTRPGGVVDEDVVWRRVLFQATRSGSGPLVERLARAILQEASKEEQGRAKDYAHWPLSGLPELSNTRIILPEGGDQQDSASRLGREWDLASLSRTLAEDENRVFAVAAISTTLETLGAHLLLLIDQLEEVFTTVAAGKDERAAFFASLRDLAACGRVWIVATMRSEYFARIADEPELHSLVAKDDGGYILPPPDRQSLQEIIRFPAAAGRLEFERSVSSRTIAGEKSSHDSLDAQILADAESNPDALPLLEFTLRSLYELDIENAEEKSHTSGTGKNQRILTWDSYEKIGGLKGAIGETAGRAFHQLSTPAQEAAKAVFAALVRIDPINGEAVRQPASLTSLREIPGGEEFLQAFLEKNLLVTHASGPEDAPHASLVHEALITHWPVLANWLAVDETRGRVLAYQRFKEAHLLYQNEGGELLRDSRLAEAIAIDDDPYFSLTTQERRYLEKSIRAAKRRLRFLQTALAVFVLVAIVAAFSSWSANRTSRELTERSAESDFRTASSLMEEDRAEQAAAFLARAVRTDPSNAKAIGTAHYLLTERTWLIPEEIGLGAYAGSANCLSISKFGEKVLVGTRDGKVLLTGNSEGMPHLLFESDDGEITNVRLSNKEDRVVLETEQSLTVLDIDTRLPIVSITRKTDDESRKWDLSNQNLAIVSRKDQKYELRIVGTEAGEDLFRIELDSRTPAAVKISPDNSYVTVAYTGRRRGSELVESFAPRVFDLNSLKEKMLEAGDPIQDEFTLLEYSSDSKYLILSYSGESDGAVAEGGQDTVGSLQLIDLESGKTTVHYRFDSLTAIKRQGWVGREEHTEKLSGILTNFRGVGYDNKIITLSQDGSGRIWYLSNSAEESKPILDSRTQFTTIHPIYDGYSLEDGKFVTRSFEENTRKTELRIWDGATPLSERLILDGGVRHLSVATDATEMAYINDDGLVFRLRPRSLSGLDGRLNDSLELPKVAAPLDWRRSKLRELASTLFVELEEVNGGEWFVSEECDTFTVISGIDFSSKTIAKPDGSWIERICDDGLWVTDPGSNSRRFWYFDFEEVLRDANHKARLFEIPFQWFGERVSPLLFSGDLVVVGVESSDGDSYSVRSFKRTASDKSIPLWSADVIGRATTAELDPRAGVVFISSITNSVGEDGYLYALSLEDGLQIAEP